MPYAKLTVGAGAIIPIGTGIMGVPEVEKKHYINSFRLKDRAKITFLLKTNNKQTIYTKKRQGTKNMNLNGKAELHKLMINIAKFDLFQRRYSLPRYSLPGGTGGGKPGNCGGGIPGGSVGIPIGGRFK